MNHALYNSGREGHRRRGSAMVISIVGVFAVAAMSAVFLQMSHTITKRQTHSADLKRAMYLAEAGLAESYIGLSMAKTGNVGSSAEPALFGDGLFWVEAEEVDSTMVQLESTALAGSARITLGLVVERADVSIGSLGFYSQQELVVAPGATIDSYDSAAGAYADQVASGENNSAAIVGSNAGIMLNGTSSATTIRGDVVPGPRSSVTQRGTVTVTGSTQSRGSSIELPAPEPPAPATDRGVMHTSPIPLVISSGVQGIASLSIGPDATAVVVGPATIVASNVALAPGATLEFDVAEGPVDFFVAGDFLADAGAILSNTSDDPTRASIQLTERADSSFGSVTLGDGVSFFGTVYAPESNVTLGVGSEICGAVVADSLTLGENASLHFDLAIARGDTTLPKLVNWRVLEVPAGLAASSSDPFRLMGVDRTSLRSPAESHEMQWLDLEYVNDRGVTETYSGWEPSFDWMDVDEVLQGSRDGTSITEATMAESPTEDMDLKAPGGTPEDWISNPGIGTRELAGYLKDASPLSTEELTDAAKRMPAMKSGEYYAVLTDNMPLDSETLQEVIQADVLKNKHIYDVIELHAPVDDEVLVALIQVPNVPSAILREALVLHSPLSTTVQSEIDSNVNAMSGADARAVDAAQ